MGKLYFFYLLGLCPDWENWQPENALPNCTEAMDAAEEWLDVPQVSQLHVCYLFIASQPEVLTLLSLHIRYSTLLIVLGCASVL